VVLSLLWQSSRCEIANFELRREYVAALNLRLQDQESSPMKGRREYSLLEMRKCLN
jgi:hypothetical protein